VSILVDTNVILDVITDDPRWAEWSADMLMRHEPQGLAINSMIYAELAGDAHSVEEVDDLVARFGLLFLELPRTALFLAAKAFQRYRANGGTRSSILPDFFIGGHAEASGLPLLTRDVGRYRTYFPSVQLLTPP
jgi:predicted nucleic acid-binding protein